MSSDSSNTNPSSTSTSTCIFPTTARPQKLDIDDPSRLLTESEYTEIMSLLDQTIVMITHLKTYPDHSMNDEWNKDEHLEQMTQIRDYIKSHRKIPSVSGLTAIYFFGGTLEELMLPYADGWEMFCPLQVDVISLTAIQNLRAKNISEKQAMGVHVSKQYEYDVRKYGSRDGPDWNFTIRKYNNDYKRIVESSQRSNPLPLKTNLTSEELAEAKQEAEKFANEIRKQLPSWQQNNDQDLSKNIPSSNKPSCTIL